MATKSATPKKPKGKLAKAEQGPPAAKVGRPSTLTPALTDAICQAVEMGISETAAAGAQGVDQGTISGWKRKGYEQPGSTFAVFAVRLEKARHVAECGLLRVIHTASVDTWQAAAWILERRFHRSYGQKNLVTVELERELNGVIERLGKGLTPDEFERALVLISAQPDGDGGTGQAAAEANHLPH